jgi:hypothetical protein
MKRQGLKVSIKELRKIVDDLEKENTKILLEYSHQYDWDFIDKLNRKKWIVNIINKKGLSDTWEFEKFKEVKR